MGTISIRAWQLEDRAEQWMSLSRAPESVSGRVRALEVGAWVLWGRGSLKTASCLQTVLPVDTSLTESMTVRMKHASLSRDALLHSGTAGEISPNPVGDAGTVLGGFSLNVSPLLSSVFGGTLSRMYRFPTTNGNHLQVLEQMAESLLSLNVPQQFVQLLLQEDTSR